MKTQFALSHGKTINGLHTVTLKHDGETIARSIQTNGRLPICHRYRDDLSGLAECIAFVKLHGSKAAKSKLASIHQNLSLEHEACGEYELSDSEKEEISKVIGGRGKTQERLWSIMNSNDLGLFLGSSASRFVLSHGEWQYVGGQYHDLEIQDFRKCLRNS